jgi:putative ABC transport system ATP-binding protein
MSSCHIIQHDNKVRVLLENVGVVRKNLDSSLAVILEGISFSVCQSEITVILGPSGSGKSTVLRLVNRLDELSTGTIYLNGDDITTVDPLLLRRKIGMVLQKPFMFEGTVLSNLQYPFLYRNMMLPPAGSDEVVRALSLVRLTQDMLERDARSLSGGEQQRVNLARVLISRPDVLLLDEPTSALDRPSTDHLATTLQDICKNEQLAIIMATHDLRLAEHTVDHLIYLEQGKLVEQGFGPEMLKEPRTSPFRQFLAAPEKDEE